MKLCIRSQSFRSITVGDKFRHGGCEYIKTVGMHRVDDMLEGKVIYNAVCPSNGVMVNFSDDTEIFVDMDWAYLSDVTCPAYILVRGELVYMDINRTLHDLDNKSIMSDVAEDEIVHEVKVVSVSVQEAD